MGCLFSCYSSSTREQPDHCVRVVHLNGYIEDFVPSVSVSHVVANAPHHLLCSSVQLLNMGSCSSTFRTEEPLLPGRIYFQLPLSLLDSPESSPIDLASIVKRLTAAAKRAGPANVAAVGSASGPARPGNFRSQSVSSWKPELETIMEMSSFGSGRDGDSSEYLLLHHPNKQLCPMTHFA